MNKDIRDEIKKIIQDSEDNRRYDIKILVVTLIVLILLTEGLKLFII